MACRFCWSWYLGGQGCPRSPILIFHLQGDSAAPALLIVFFSLQETQEEREHAADGLCMVRREGGLPPRPASRPVSLPAPTAKPVASAKGGRHNVLGIMITRGAPSACSLGGFQAALRGTSHCSQPWWDAPRASDDQAPGSPESPHCKPLLGTRGAISDPPQ